MPDSTVPSAAPTSRPKPRRWLRRLGIVSGALLVLLIAGYFVLTSGAFFKGVILPKVGQAMHATVTVADASISPFSRVVLRDLKVQTTGSEPLVTAQEARVQYSLWAIMKGNFKVPEVALISPTVTVVKNADGTSNLDPITKSSTKEAPAKKPASGPGSPPSSSGKPPQIDLSKFALNNATVRYITLQPGGGREVVEISKLNITLDNLKNGQNAKLTAAADLSLDKQPPAPASRAAVQAKLEASGDLALGNDLSLTLAKLQARISVPQASGALSEVNGFALSLDTDLSADPAKQSAVLRAFNLNASRRGTTLLQTRQSAPVTVSWGGGAPFASDATLSIILTNVNLADWKGFAPPDLDPVGQVHGTLELVAQQAGKNVRLNLAVAVDQFGAKIGTNTLSNLQLTLSAPGEVLEFNNVKLPQIQFALAAPQGPILSGGASVIADIKQNTADVDAKLEANLARLLMLQPQNGIELKSGQVQLNTKVSRRDKAVATTGTLQVQTLTGKFGERPFQDLALGSTYDVAIADPEHIELKQVQITLAPTERARTNAVTLSGRLDRSNPDAMNGGLKLAADTLDVTSYYDLFESTSTTKPAARPSSRTGAKSPPPSNEPEKPEIEKEPPGMRLPVNLLTADIQVGRCFLRELVLSDVNASARVESNRITIKPIVALLNGRTNTASIALNVGVPGYEYDITYNGDHLPLEPIANSFSPEYRGQAKGDIFVALNLKGAGVTGPSLQKNLGGALQMSFTNAEIQLVGPKAKAMLTPIAVGLGYPDLLKSPLRWFGADAKIAEGKLRLNQFSLVSPAFIAATHGEIPFAAKLSESPIRSWPVDFSLPRALAERLKLAPKDASATNDFVPLPNLVKAVGTLGNAGTKFDSVALLQLGARTLTEIPGLNKDASKLINQADSLLGGRLTGNTNAASTNQPSTNAPANPLSRKLGDLLKPKGK